MYVLFMNWSVIGAYDKKKSDMINKFCIQST